MDWNFDSDLEVHGFGYNFYIEGSLLEEFNVLSRFDIKSIEASQQNLCLGMLALFAAIISPISILIIEIGRENSRRRDNQIGFLKNIITRINLILGDLENFRKESKKRRRKGSFYEYMIKYCDIRDVNSDFYESILDQEIDRKPTKEIIRELIQIDYTIQIINKSNRDYELKIALGIMDGLVKKLGNLKEKINHTWNMKTGMLALLRRKSQ